MIISNDKSLIIRIGKNSDLKEIKNIDESLKITINKNEQIKKYNALKQAVKNKNLIISLTKSRVIGYLWYDYLWGYVFELFIFSDILEPNRELFFEKLLTD